MERLKTWLTVIGLVLGLPAAAVQFTASLRAHWGIVSYVLLVALVVASLYVLLARLPRGPGGAPAAPRYPKQRWLGCVGLALALVAVVGPPAYRWVVPPPDRVLFVVAELDGPEDQRQQVTSEFIAKLDSALEVYKPRLAVHRADTVVKEGDPDPARVGRNRNATLFVWGWYYHEGSTRENWPACVHFACLRPPRWMPAASESMPPDVPESDLARGKDTPLRGNLDRVTADAIALAAWLAQWIADSTATLATVVASGAAEPVAQAQAFYYRANDYLQRHKPDSAVEAYTMALELRPHNEAALYGRARAYYEQRAFDSAIADYTRAITLKPNDASCLLGRGWAYEDRKDHDSALADFTTAINLRPGGYAAAFYGRGYVYYWKREYGRAISDLSAAIRLDSLHRKAIFYRGLARLRSDSVPEAESDLRKADRLEPGSADYGLATVAARRGNAGEAFRLLDSGLTRGRLSFESVESDPALAPLRTDPRWQSLRSRFTPP